MKLAFYMSSALLSLSLTAASGCTSGNARDGNAGGPVAMTTEAPGEGASVSLRGRVDPLAPSQVVLDVVARGAADLHGAAFRMTWDPEAITFVSATSGTPWSKQVLAMAKEGSPGQLAVLWTEKGETGIDASHETVIGTVTFAPRGRQGSPIAFKTERSQLVDKQGVPIVATWTGGSLAAR